MVEVAYSEQHIQLDGWIEADALGTTGTRVPRSPGAQPVRSSKRDTRLLARPAARSWPGFRATPK
jgi:hypothetical protein